MCVVGKNLRHEFRVSIDNTDIDEILSTYSQEDVFIMEVVDILSTKQWLWLQQFHDKIASGKKFVTSKNDLFTEDDIQLAFHSRSLGNSPVQHVA